MKITNIFVCSGLLLAGTSILAGGMEPNFAADGSIQMSAQGGSCGGVTFEPKPGASKARAIKLVAYKITHPLWGEDDWGQSIGSTDLQAPLRQRYDWAGINADDRYAIKCYEVTSEFQGGQNLAPCKDVINLTNIKHNVGCVIGPAGPQADYSPLNMNKG